MTYTQVLANVIVFVVSNELKLSNLSLMCASFFFKVKYLPLKSAIAGERRQTANGRCGS